MQRDTLCYASQIRVCSTVCNSLSVGLEKVSKLSATRDKYPLPVYSSILPSLLYARNKKRCELGNSPTNASCINSAGSCGSTRTKAIHLYALHGEASLGAIPPSWHPDRTCVPEFKLSRGTLITPWFIPDLIPNLELSCQGF